MEERNETNTMLQLMTQPAFRVEEGVISYVNQAAAGYFVEAGQSIAPLIVCGGEEYEEFCGGCLYVTLSIGGCTVGASVTQVEDAHIFVLEQHTELPQLQALALAAMELREPLSSMLILADRMLPGIAKNDDTLSAQAAQMNRRLYQLQRIISNMSDAAVYAQAPQVPMEYVEICGFLEETLEKTAALSEQAGVRLEYTLPREMIYTLADSDKLERAVYNILSNAIKFTPEGGVIQAKLVQKNKRLYFSVTNPRNGPGPQGNIYTRFLRQPGLEDSRNGIGLGMVLVRSVAAVHGGAVLVDQADDNTRITLTMQMRRSNPGTVRSPSMRIDYAGERDHGLMELADVLPASAYSVENES